MDEARRLLLDKGYTIVDEQPADLSGWRALIFEPAVVYEDHIANGISGQTDEEIAERADELPTNCRRTNERTTERNER